MKITALVFLLLLVSGMAVHSAEPSKISDSQAKEVIVASLTVQQMNRDPPNSGSSPLCGRVYPKGVQSWGTTL